VTVFIATQLPDASNAAITESKSTDPCQVTPNLIPVYVAN